LGISAESTGNAYSADRADGDAAAVIKKKPFLRDQIYILIPGVVLFFAALACAGSFSSAAPINTNIQPARTEIISTTAQPLVESTSQPTQISPSPAIQETRRLTLEFPSRMRAAVESDVIRLTLEVDDLGNITPTATVNGNDVIGKTVEIPDLYDTHNVTAEAQLDLAGMTVNPAGPTFESLSRGQSVTFYWSIRPEQVGKYRGTVWLHLNFANKATGEKSRIPVSAQIIEIDAVDFFGLSVNLARTSGVIGSVIGGVIGFPFLEDILKFLFKRRKRI
jgi:hypothetical protein